MEFVSNSSLLRRLPARSASKLYAKMRCLRRPSYKSTSSSPLYFLPLPVALRLGSPTSTWHLDAPMACGFFLLARPYKSSRSLGETRSATDHEYRSPLSLYLNARPKSCEGCATSTPQQEPTVSIFCEHTASLGRMKLNYPLFRVGLTRNIRSPSSCPGPKHRLTTRLLWLRLR